MEPPAGQTPYEAVYYIGCDLEHDRYIMHLLDTFGAGFSRILGIGERQGMSIAFVFEYATGPLTNTLSWQPDTEEWTFDLTFPEDGTLRTFATKRMSRV